MPVRRAPPARYRKALEVAKFSLKYEPETGHLIYVKAFSLMGYKQFLGQRAGSPKRPGKRYRTIRIQGIHFLEHRLIWYLVHGEWPEILDHINGDTGDNRLANLREANGSENCCNRRIGKNNTTGFKGVCFNKKEGKYQAMIGKDYKAKYLGLFDTAEQAAEAYRKASKELHGAFANDGGKPCPPTR